MYNTNINNQQKVLIFKYMYLGYIKDEIMDRMLFSSLADKNIIIYDDVENVMNEYSHMHTLQRTEKIDIQDLLKDDNTYDSTKYYRSIPTVSKAIEIASKYHKEVEDIRW